MDLSTKNRRYETCVRCRKRWNISRERKVPLAGYLCPDCVAGDKRIQHALDRGTAKRIAWAAAAAMLTVILSMWARAAAVEARGSTAWGGEMLVPLLPLVGWCVWRTVRDWWRVIREELHEEATR